MKIKQIFYLSVPILCLAQLAGCSGKSAPSGGEPNTASSTSDDHGHSHASQGAHGHGAGPHGGTLADWGGGAYHVEFTVDHDKKEATVYVLGSDEKSPEPVSTDKILLTINVPQLQVDLLPAPLEGEAAGLCSRFVGAHDALATVREFEGTISGVVDGTPYAGNFKEETGDHSHGKDDALVWEGDPKQHAGLVIKLGHHGKHLLAGEEIEPAVSITRGGEPVRNAQVFNALFDIDGIELAPEVATVFEPATAEEPAHYAQGALTIPAGVSEVVVRFRIVPAGADEVQYDVPIKVE